MDDGKEHKIMNGGAHSPEPELPSIDPDPAAASGGMVLSQDQARAMIDQQIGQVMGVTISGLRVYSPGIPPIILLPAIARACGMLLAGAVVGNTLEISAKARKDFREAFEEGMRKIPIVQPAAAPAPFGSQG